MLWMFSHHSIPVPSADITLAKWSQDHNGQPPQGHGTHREKNWDGISCIATSSSLLDSATDEVTRARLLAVMSRDSGVWLQALPDSGICTLVAIWFTLLRFFQFTVCP